MTYEVLKEMHHLGRRYLPGESVELKSYYVHQLVAKGYVREVPPPVPVDCGGCAPPVFIEAEAKTATKPLPPPGRVLKGAF